MSANKHAQLKVDSLLLPTHMQTMVDILAAYLLS
jgi:hypothetical protein